MRTEAVGLWPNAAKAFTLAMRSTPVHSCVVANWRFLHCRPTLGCLLRGIISMTASTGCRWCHAGGFEDRTAAFLRQLQVPRLPLPLSDLGSFVVGPLLGSGGVVARLPVADDLYKELANVDPAFKDILQPVSACGAYKLSRFTSAALSAVMDTPDDEITVAGEPRSSAATDAHRPSRTVLWHVKYTCDRLSCSRVVCMATQRSCSHPCGSRWLRYVNSGLDCLRHAGYVDKHVYDIMACMEKVLHTHNLKRKRNCTEDSLTGTRLRPDFSLLVKGRLLFKGEDKTLAGDIDKAELELTTKLKAWSVVYHDTVSTQGALQLLSAPTDHIREM